MKEYEIPNTEQGLRDFLRLAESEIKRSTLRIQRLQDMSFTCRAKLDLIKEQKEKECIR